MRCYICDAQLNNISFNRLHKDIDPCERCKEVIANVFGEEGDEASDEIIEEPSLEELMAADEEVINE